MDILFIDSLPWKVTDWVYLDEHGTVLIFSELCKINNICSFMALHTLISEPKLQLYALI